ncbi:MAG: HPr family phosphocarrier protein, partial [Planctomycetota bacterium]
RAAGRFVSNIELVHEQQHADAKSIMHMLTLGARQDAVLELRATGADAAEAVAALGALFDSNFENDPITTENSTPPDGALH